MLLWGIPTFQIKQGGRETVLEKGRAYAGVSWQQNRNTKMNQGGSSKDRRGVGLDLVKSVE